MTTLSAPAETLARPKPRLRGVLHQWAAPVSFLAGVPLIVLTGVERGRGAATLVAVYVLTIVLLFSISALYHRRSWSPASRARMRRLDHSMIFVFIGGSYTAFAALAMKPATARMLMVVVWTGVAIGLALSLAWTTAPRFLNVLVYLALGWVAVFIVPQILHHAGVAALVLVVVGGAFYTVGAITYGLKRPDPSPLVFGFHEVFHLCTILAAMCHQLAIWLALY
jgi:hemolysin III